MPVPPGMTAREYADFVRGLQISVPGRAAEDAHAASSRPAISAPVEAGDLVWFRAVAAAAGWGVSEGGGSSPFTIIGPFAFAFDTPGASSQAELTALASGVVVLRAWVRITTLWADGTDLVIGAGGPTAVSDGDYWTVAEYSNGSGAIGRQEDPGAWKESSFPVAGRFSVVTLKQAGFLVVSIGGAPDAGTADAYAEIYTPT